ncbi:hypothetical protein HDU96_006330 [Phlyctochytrium bullatum]|nr:hypothetical protein HDU96_006330 [Phlyctochytrium bullatum]
METDDDEEHRVYELKRIVARLSRDETILLKGVIGHLSRLGDALSGEGINLNRSVAYVFASFLFQIPTCASGDYILEAPSTLSQSPASFEANAVEGDPQPSDTQVEPKTETEDEVAAASTENLWDNQVTATLPAVPVEVSSGKMDANADDVGEQISQDTFSDDGSELIVQGAGAEKQSEEQVVTGSDLYGFGWDRISKRSLASCLFLEEIVATPSAAALQLLMMFFDGIFDLGEYANVPRE